MSHPMPSDYAHARIAFLDAATRRGARIESVAHPRQGLHGEALATDLAWIGPPDAARVVLSLSGTHGVEGLHGSACQRAALAGPLADRLPADTALAFVHAVNPYGFSWLRRVDHENIDVNRNFVDFTAPPVNPDYAGVHPLLVPDEWGTAALGRLRADLDAAVARLGRQGMARAISGGQYTHPDGLFYGGGAPCWSHRTIADLLSRTLRKAAAVCVLDHHTGLGPAGHTELICRHAPGSRELALARAWWGADVTSPASGESVSVVLGGNLREAVAGWSPRAATVVAIALEVGTTPAETVLTALVADNWLHRRDDPRSALGERIRGQVRAAFFLDDAAWLTSTVARAQTVLAQALDGLAREPA
jgi:hypothetical protein